MTSASGRGGRRTAPYAFTEQGVALLSSVLVSAGADALRDLMTPPSQPRRRIGFNTDDERRGE